MKTPRKILRKFNKDKTKAQFICLVDGLFITFIKKIFIWKIWDAPHQCFIRIILCMASKLDREYPNRSGAESATRWAMDWYTLLITIILIVSYAVVYLMHGCANTIWVLAGYVLCFVIPSFRIMEMLSVFATLHLRGRYCSTAPMRALVVAFVFYMHLVLGFAVLYLISAHFNADTFTSTDGQSIDSSFINSFYFSFVTCTTLGYGDLRPNHWLGKLLVFLEVFIGIVFVVVIFQRAIAASQENTKAHD